MKTSSNPINIYKNQSPLFLIKEKEKKMKEYYMLREIILSVVFLTIFSGCSDNPSGPQTPSLRLSPDNLVFSVWDTTKSFQILNEGAGTLTWEVTEESDYNWMSLTPINGENDSWVNISVKHTDIPSGNYQGTVSVNSNGGDYKLEVQAQVPYFADNFSGNLSKWNNFFCKAWIQDQELHLEGNSSGYYGAVSHSFSSALPLGYTYNVKLASVNRLKDNMYGPCIQIDDKGSPRFVALWFCILDGSDCNWQLIAFLTSGISSTWALIDSASYGYSSLIKTEACEWNDVSLMISEDKTISVHIGDNLLYTSNEISKIEDDFNINVGMGCEQIELWTRSFKEVKVDEAVIINSNENVSLKKIYTPVDNENNQYEIQNPAVHKLTSKSVYPLTVYEVLNKFSQ